MIYLIPAALLFIIGWFVKYKKTTWLISGYNTASKEKKEMYDIDKLTRLVGNFIFVLAIIFVIMAVVTIIIGGYKDVVTYVGFGVLAVTIIIGVVFLNTGGRVKKDS